MEIGRTASQSGNKSRKPLQDQVGVFACCLFTDQETHLHMVWEPGKVYRTQTRALWLALVEQLLLLCFMAAVVNH
eukprot:2957175-Amphidinium_carterae.1